MDYMDEDTNDIASVVFHSLKSTFPDGLVIILHAQCADSGGGRTKYVFACAMGLKGMINEHYLVCIYLRHNLQTCLINVIKSVLGEGGLEEQFF